ncbi:MAG: NUDIX domain-containing protein [Candidatus Diapherotrites archaeon]|uniref:NUDIX domain-containing protein n=1 Tax=Candidatus Iainarchaeum sp. TaxID=3101447 RepID=A0A7J4IW16_9ARCH|nr:MAG: hypothetical protein QT03_C0001G1035 [archaeon GW2011_AR10]MBS3059537.1 NUDIX domain-containing protein [Candidatus Diapherotrites archaeon]HIH07917.1 NUDIX domain-containing protein [Candidatus Diapherotrites archaeon]
MQDQLLLLVDENDKFSGQYAPREKCHFGKGIHHRAFAIIVYNKKKEILLQLRKHKLWDNFWDLTAASHPLHLKERDESYQEAGSRCLKAEFGFDVKLETLFGYNYFAKYGEHCENEYCALLAGEFNGKVKPDRKAVKDFKWQKLDALEKDVKKDKNKFTPWLIVALEELKKQAPDFLR